MTSAAISPTWSTSTMRAERGTTRAGRIRSWPSAACRLSWWPATARRVVECVEQRLLTPLGLRSLAPDEPGYASHDEGDSSARDAVYHQGTVWPWLMGSFVDAWLRVRGNTEPARVEARSRFVEPLIAHLDEAALGHVSEIADAEPPFTTRGCPFQAWSLGELLRVQRVILAAPKMASAAPLRT